MSQIMPAFVVLLVGTFFCSVMFSVEFIVKCLSKCKEEIKVIVHWDSEKVVLVLTLILLIYINVPLAGILHVFKPIMYV